MNTHTLSKLTFAAMLTAGGLAQGCSGSDDRSGPGSRADSGAVPTSVDADRPPDAEPEVQLDDGIVYVRLPRTTTGKEYQGELVDMSFADRMPETFRILGGFNAPGQLVWRKEDGTEVILYDCMDRATVNEPTCVPMDPMVSFGGSKVAFSVIHGTYKINNQTGIPYLGSATHASIHIYDLTDGTLTDWPHEPGTFDTAPVWLPDGKMMFTSTRAKIYSQSTKRISPYRQPALQLWIADRDGQNARNVSPHEQRSTLHPYVHSSGRVLYSSWQFNFVRTHSSTHHNLWWLMSVDRRGGDLQAHLHAHEKSPEFQGELFLLTSPHFIGERSNGDVCTTLYYRGNNLGAGKILCWPTRGAERSPLGHEGASPFGLPEGAYVAIEGDAGDAGGLWQHVRDPMGLSDGQLLYSGSVAANGRCHFSSMANMAAYTRAGETCDLGIHKSVRIPAVAPADHETIVDSPQWHEIMARPVKPYQEIYEIARPGEAALSDTGDDTCVFASVTGTEGDVLNRHGWQGPDYPRWCKEQGCALHGVPLEQVRSIRFWQAVPNETWFPNSELDANWGQKLRLLGDVPLQQDGSFKAQIPCDVPFLMSGVDAEGRAIAWHQNLMSLRPGEKQVCAGCHLHDATDSEQRLFEDTMAANAKAIVLPVDPQPLLEWTADIYPMLTANCAGCHDGSQRPNLAADSVAVYAELTNHGIAPNSGLIDGVATVPWISRYVNAFFSRESLLYWKAAGERLDGRTDAERTDDFNFGPAHPKRLTDAQLRTLSNWLEAGAYRAQ